MATCEFVLDVANYVEIPPEPAWDPAREPEADYRQRRRAWELLASTRNTQRQFFLAVRWFLRNQLGFNKIKATFGDFDPANKAKLGIRIDDALGLTVDEAARFLAVAGILIADSQTDPLNGKTIGMLSAASGDTSLLRDGDDPADPEVKTTHPVVFTASFNVAMTRALSEYNAYRKHYNRVYALLKDASESPLASAGFAKNFRYRARQIAVLSRTLIGEGANPEDSHYASRFERALSTALPGGNDGPSSTIDIDLPDLDAGTEADIIVDNVKALSAIYFSAMLEELKFFSVMDKVVEQFMNGALPIKKSAAGDPLYRYHRDAQTRITEFERRGLYARSFGVAQGSVDEAMPNREFNDVWIRFLSAVSVYGREIHSTQPMKVSTEQVFKTARDLGVNLSLHGFGLAHFAAIELQNLIKFVRDTLSNVDVLAAYGVRDVWQLVERVSNMYLGGAVNGVRQRTMATSGGAIIKWLAESAPSLVGSSGRLAVDENLISHVERWLAVTGTPDTSTEKYSEPVALQSQRTIPDFAIPNGAGAAGDAIRDALSRINLPNNPQA